MAFGSVGWLGGLLVGFVLIAVAVVVGAVAAETASSRQPAPQQQQPAIVSCRPSLVD